jgi:ABC-type multidrug transport system ATPase subunit
MQIQLTDASKRFRFDWIFKNVNYHLLEGSRTAILGPNGAGKSTFMKVLSGHLSPTRGKVLFMDKKGEKINIDDVYPRLSYAAPYIELVEEFTLRELLDFQQKFKSFQQRLTTDDIIARLGLQHSEDKAIRFFSSGMKQRLKLALAICADTELLLLDEPTTNLDQQGAVWYRQLLEEYAHQRTVIIATNVKEDYAFFCNETLDILTLR